MDVTTTFRQPGWLGLGGCLLCALAAAVNVHFITHYSLSVSHLTGDLARIPLDAFQYADAAPRLAPLFLVVVSFVAGATLAGLFIHHPRFSLKRPYGRTLMGIGLILLASFGLETQGSWLAVYFAALACGLQNAMATHFRGVVLRTTHVTGILTDLGQLAGMRLGGHTVEGWRLWLHLGLVLSFLAGGFLGYLVDEQVPYGLLLPAGLTYVLCGLIWFTAKRRFIPAHQPS